MDNKIDSGLNFGMLFSPEWLGATLSSIIPKDSEYLDAGGKAQIFRIKNFLTNEECDYITSNFIKYLEPSEITHDVENYRTSKCCNMSMCKEQEEFEKVIELDKKICNTMNIHPFHSEGIEFQHYKEGEFYKEHTDYFEPNTEEYKVYAEQYGQRTWTFMAYLNDVKEGGETSFPLLNIKIPPEKGMALAWNNLDYNGQVNSNLVHRSEEVTQGNKSIITKWFRDKRLI